MIYGDLEITNSNQVPNILVTSIVVTSEAGSLNITEDDGTLQMYAAVLPLNADDPSISWSVGDITGRGTIVQETGILQGIETGTVIVYAAANDGSGIVGELLITISNQYVEQNEQYGALYNWYAVNHGNDVAGADLIYFKKDGVPETGFRVASKVDFEKLRTYLGGESVAGGKLKETGITHWNSPNTGATNSSGYKALGAGTRNPDTGQFQSLKGNGVAWSTTQWTGETYYNFLLRYNSAEALIASANIRSGISVRAVRDILNPENPEDPTDPDEPYDPNDPDDPNDPYDPEDPDNPTTDYVPQPPYSIGNFPDYRFYISDPSSVTFEVFPLNFLSTKLIDEVESDKIFYRRKFSGTLLFGTNSKVTDVNGVVHNRCEDWLSIWGYERNDPCSKLYLTINRTRGGITEVYWEGYFSTTDGYFDIDKRTYEVTPHTLDEYTTIYDEADTPYNILASTNEVSAKASNGTTIDITYEHCHWLIDSIEYLASWIAPGAAVVSEFFSAATNYVTQAASKTTLLMIAQKSDIKRPDATNQSTDGLITWNELMQILWGMFEVTWQFDLLTNTIYVEHISKFPINLAGLIDIRPQQTAASTNKYSYSKVNMPKYEKYFFMEAEDRNFVGVPIYYESGCLNPDVKNNIKETRVNVTTDLEYIIDPDDEGTAASIDDDGWVILQCSGSAPVYDIDLEPGELDATIKFNGHLSWANLHHNYFRHNRVLIEGYLNNALTTFRSVQKTKLQECAILMCNRIDPTSNIKTELGVRFFDGELGTIKTAEISPTGEIKLTLLYGTVNYILTPVVEPDKWIRIDMVATESYVATCNTFHAILSEAAPAGFELIIQYTVYGEFMEEICSNPAPYDTWSIAEGETVADYEITLDCTIPVDVYNDNDNVGCVHYRINANQTWIDSQGVTRYWLIYLEYSPDCKCFWV